MALASVEELLLCEEKEEAWDPDPLEVEALAKMLYGEARGISSDMEKAACCWCVLNRVDSPLFPDTVLEVLEAPGQFCGYDERHPLWPELEELAADVLCRHHAEQEGEEDCGRVLPKEYLYFAGDGQHNHFCTSWQGGEAWGWSLEDPYGER